MTRRQRLSVGKKGLGFNSAPPPLFPGHSPLLNPFVKETARVFIKEIPGTGLESASSDSNPQGSVLKIREQNNGPSAAAEL